MILTDSHVSSANQQWSSHHRKGFICKLCPITSNKGRKRGLKQFKRPSERGRMLQPRSLSSKIISKTIAQYSPLSNSKRSRIRNALPGDLIRRSTPSSNKELNPGIKITKRCSWKCEAKRNSTWIAWTPQKCIEPRKSTLEFHKAPQKLTKAHKTSTNSAQAATKSLRVSWIKKWSSKTSCLATKALQALRGLLTSQESKDQGPTYRPRNWPRANPWRKVSTPAPEWTLSSTWCLGWILRTPHDWEGQWPATPSLGGY